MKGVATHHIGVYITANTRPLFIQRVSVIESTYI